MNDFIERNRLLRREAPVLVGVSGGADSVALLLSLRRLGFDLRVAHCNFHLRGAESMRDMRFVSELCRHLGVDLYIKDFDVPRRMKATGESVEMACRSLRYQWFGELLDRDMAQAVAVGHHREDQAETVLINLMRGTGPAGIAGMRPKNSGALGGTVVARPLLEMSRGEIEEYLRALDRDWVSDSSNSGDEFLRNRVRHHVLPEMALAFPSAVDGIVNTASHMAENHAFHSFLLKKFFSQYKTGNVYDLKGILNDVENHAFVAFRDLLAPYGFSVSQVKNIIDGVRRNASGVRFHASDVVGELSRGRFTILNAGATRIEDEVYSIDLRRDISEPIEVRVFFKDIKEFPMEKKFAPGKAALIDADAVLNGSWEMRHWRRGDKMYPFGMKGAKLVSDIFRDAKLDAAQKRNAWLVTRDGRIVWIPGIKNSSLHTVGPGSKRYVRLEID